MLVVITVIVDMIKWLIDICQWVFKKSVIIFGVIWSVSQSFLGFLFFLICMTLITRHILLFCFFDVLFVVISEILKKFMLFLLFLLNIENKRLNALFKHLEYDCWFYAYFFTFICLKVHWSRFGLSFFTIIFIIVIWGALMIIIVIVIWILKNEIVLCLSS